MIIGVPKEIKLQEHRIGLTPESVKLLTSKGHEVLVEKNGGFEAGFTDENYINSGAKIIDLFIGILSIIFLAFEDVQTKSLSAFISAAQFI